MKALTNIIPGWEMVNTTSSSSHQNRNSTLLGESHIHKTLHSFIQRRSVEDAARFTGLQRKANWIKSSISTEEKWTVISASSTAADSKTATLIVPGWTFDCSALDDNLSPKQEAICVSKEQHRRRFDFGCAKVVKAEVWTGLQWRRSTSS